MRLLALIVLGLAIAAGLLALAAARRGEARRRRGRLPTRPSIQDALERARSARPVKRVLLEVTEVEKAHGTAPLRSLLDDKEEVRALVLESYELVALPGGGDDFDTAKLLFEKYSGEALSRSLLPCLLVLDATGRKVASKTFAPLAKEEELLAFLRGAQPESSRPS